MKNSTEADNRLSEKITSIVAEDKISEGRPIPTNIPVYILMDLSAVQQPQPAGRHVIVL